MRAPASSIELLESRIAPAALNAAGTFLTYTDIDGDFVKVTFTGAKMDPSDFTFAGGFRPGDITTPQSLDLVGLAGKTGAGFTLTATPKAGKGDSHANIASIDAALTNVGTIKVDGDVVLFSAGTGAAGTVGVKSFTVFSMGQSTTSNFSNTLANVGSFTVKTDVSNLVLTFTGGVKSLFIGGNLQELGNASAKLKITGDVGSLKIGGSVIGRNGGDANISMGGKVGTFSIGGSVIGGDADSPSFQILAGDVKTFSLGGDLRGGRGTHGGNVALGNVGTLRIGGSIVAADNVSSNGLLTLSEARSITIGGSILGGDATSGSVNDNGALEVLGSIGTLKLGHDLIGGRESGGTLDDNGSITVLGTVGKMTIGGSVIGDSTHATYISVGGGTVTTALAAIKTLTIKGSLVHTRLLAGYTFGSIAKNLDSGFGSISIGGDLAASFIYAGCGVGGDSIAGTSDDNAVSAVATIGSVKVGGAFRGIAGDSTSFYIYAPIVNKVTVAKAIYKHERLLLGVRFDSIGVAVAQSVH
jgi:hypothetical protein